MYKYILLFSIALSSLSSCTENKVVQNHTVKDNNMLGYSLTQETDIIISIYDISGQKLCKSILKIKLYESIKL
ncbi:MAG: hypothetical protein ACI976_002750 [Aureispira sp.]|jgi:hypothetical protein